MLVPAPPSIVLSNALFSMVTVSLPVPVLILLLCEPLARTTVSFWSLVFSVMWYPLTIILSSWPLAAVIVKKSPLNVI